VPARLIIDGRSFPPDKDRKHARARAYFTNAVLSSASYLNVGGEDGGNPQNVAYT